MNKMWATRDKTNPLHVVELWIDKPVRVNGYWMLGPDLGHGLYFMSITLFKLRYKRLPRLDRAMRVTLTGRVAK